MFNIGKSPEPAKEEQGNVCPFLGLSDDPQTSLSFPSQWNACHRTKPAFLPNLDHQRVFCLSESHVTCPIFNKRAGAALPDEVRLLGIKKPGDHKWLLWLMLLLLVVGGAVGAWMFIGGSKNNSNQHPSVTPSQEISPERSSTATETTTASVTFTPLLPGVTIVLSTSTETASPTSTPTSTVTLTPSKTLRLPTAPPIPTNTQVPVQQPSNLPTFVVPVDTPTNTPSGP